MADISKINPNDGTVYNIKDTTARNGLTDRPTSFVGTRSEWNALPVATQVKYSLVNLIGEGVYKNNGTGLEKIADVGMPESYPANNVMMSDGETSVEDAISEMHTNFQAGVDDIYDAVVAKGSTPASHSLSDVVDGIAAIPTGITPTGTINITANGNSQDVSSYQYANVNVPNSNSGTYTASSRGAALDMGATNTYRYVNTNGVPNSNSATYTTTTRENKDLGAANTYRYVNTSNMPNVNSTTYTASTRSSKIDLGAANTYRYLVTSGVPNSNSTTYTYGSGSTGGKVDLGETNSYRYVNAANVYAKGKKDLSITKKYRFICDTTNKWGVVLMFTVTVSNGAVTVTPRPTSSPYNYALSINADLYTGWTNFRTSDAVTYKVEETSW